MLWSTARKTAATSRHVKISIPSFSSWLVSQCHRKEGTGILARCWIDSKRVAQDLNFDDWLKERQAGAILGAEILTARTEYESDCDSMRAGRHAQFYSSLIARQKSSELDAQKRNWHKQHPEISADEYLRIKHMLLWAVLQRKTLVYLDKCHWIGLRNVALQAGVATEPYRRLLDLLRELKQNGLILCPTSFPLLLELMKQSDDRTRLATAYLMDELGDGVCLPAGPVVQENEARQHALYSMFGANAPDSKEWLWTKACWILGMQIPQSPAFSPEDNLWLQKSYIDHVWQSRIGDLVETLRQNEWQGLDYPLFTSAHNLEGVFYRKQNFKFKEILMHEKKHMLLQLLESVLPKIAADLMAEYPDKVAAIQKTGPTATQPSPWALPSMQIVASIRASFFSAGQRLKENDLVDAEHASVALPYCDIFACDGPLAHRLKCRPLEFDKIYNTKVVATASDLEQTLNEIKKSSLSKEP